MTMPPNADFISDAEFNKFIDAVRKDDYFSGLIPTPSEIQLCFTLYKVIGVLPESLRIGFTDDDAEAVSLGSCSREYLLDIFIKENYESLKNTAVFNPTRLVERAGADNVLSSQKLLSLYKDDTAELLNAVLDNASGDYPSSNLTKLVRDEKTLRIVMDRYPCKSLAWAGSRESLEDNIFQMSALKTEMCLRLLDAEPRDNAMRLAGYMEDNPNLSFLVKWKIVNMSERPTLKPLSTGDYVDGMYLAESTTLMLAYLLKTLDRRKTDPASCTDEELSDMVTIIMKRAPGYNEAALVALLDIKDEIDFARHWRDMSTNTLRYATASLIGPIIRERALADIAVETARGAHTYSIWEIFFRVHPVTIDVVSMCPHKDLLESIVKNKYHGPFTGTSDDNKRAVLDYLAVIDVANNI